MWDGMDASLNHCCHWWEYSGLLSDALGIPERLKLNLEQQAIYERDVGISHFECARM